MKSIPWMLAASADIEVGRVVALEPAEARHLTGALRRRPGDEIVIADGQGIVAEAKLVAAGKGMAEAEILSMRRMPEPESDRVTLALALIENRAMDWAIQKAVEVGVGRFVPMHTERGQVRGRDPGVRIGHWRRIAMQALKQCRRPWAMEIGDVVPLTELVDQSKDGGVVADRGGCSIGELSPGTGSLLLVGPEGGFTPDECDLFDHRGWPRLRLGPHILRAETAAVVGGAMMVERAGR